MSDFQSFIDLIKSGSDGEIENEFKIEYVEMRNDKWWRPLHYACYYGRVGLVRKLIDNKCDINASNKNGSQAIHLACENGHIDVLKILIDNKCDINASNEWEYQPIHLACMRGHINIVKILIDNKCNMKALTKDGKSPIDIARNKGHRQIIEIIMNSATDPIESIVIALNLQCSTNCDHKFCSETLKKRKLPEGKFIGKGAFGYCYKCKISNTNREIVIKQISEMYENKEDASENKKNIERNINKFSSLINHKNIVRHFGALENSGKFCIFMEYIAGGSLQKLIDRVGHLEVNKTIQYSKEILVGLQFLHSKAIIHRDIKPENLLLDYDETVKLSDFGISRSLQKTLSESIEKATAFCGSLHYTAPEILNGEPYDYSADIWSTGATVIHMITGKKPYHDIKPAVAVIFIVGSTRKIDFTPCQPISEIMQSFIDDLLNPNQLKRPKAESLLNHSIFNNSQ